MISLKKIASDFSHLLFPHVCAGCGSDLLPDDSILCIHCAADLPLTGYILLKDNPVEKLFTGRLNINAAASVFYFSKKSVVQHLIHQLKYRGNTEAGIFLGRKAGNDMISTDRFGNIDYLVPLPLHHGKEKRRGYNQSYIICQGISETTGIPVTKHAIIRNRFTETQTKKGRIDRWKNVKDSFEVFDPTLIKNKNILLVDDVVTTGATLEACGSVILKAGAASLSILTLAYVTD